MKGRRRVDQGQHWPVFVPMRYSMYSFCVRQSNDLIPEVEERKLRNGMFSFILLKYFICGFGLVMLETADYFI